MSYLICPICQSRVRTANDLRYVREDNVAGVTSYVCPMAPLKKKGYSNSYHFRRDPVDLNLETYVYTIDIPPYLITWWDEDGYAEVIGENDEVIYKQDNISFQDYVNLYNRFSKLKVFI